MMTQSVDDELFAALAETATVLGPPTERERAAAQAARDLLAATRTYDLAELAFDSLLDDAVAVRGPALAGARELSFETEQLTLRVQVSPDQLRCTVEPAGDGTLTLLTSGGERAEFGAVGGGVFELADPPSGAVRLEFRSAAAHLVSSWVHL